MAALRVWTDERIDDFVKRYDADRKDDKEWQDRIEAKLDRRQLSPAILLAAFTPLGVGMMTAVAMVLAKGS